jgi:murein DD-endopeptidase MepM/ murein hydrolase activator NlpD
MPTPYDGKVAVWHVQGDWVAGVNTVEELAQRLKQQTPAVGAIFIKTSNGNRWQGTRDSKAAMEINGPADIARWVSAMSAVGIECHAWAVVEGLDINTEISLIVQACRVPGIKSMILDVEPYQSYWKGTAADATRLMEGIRNQLGLVFHIGMSVDPRRQHYLSIFPNSWRPHIGSIHPQCYWGEMGRSPKSILDETYQVWAGYGLPIYPVLQTWEVTPESVKEAQDIVLSKRGARGLSYFRVGAEEADVILVMNRTRVEEEIGPDMTWRKYGFQQVVAPYDPGYMDGTHTGQPSAAVFQEINAATGHRIKWKQTGAARDTVWAQWTPQLPRPGLYEISMYVPGRRATTRQARYHIKGVKGVASELLVRVDQSLYYDEWVPALVYEFDAKPGSGRVNLTDLTGEATRQIAFGPLRWREVLEQRHLEPGEGPGFDSPVGTDEERWSIEVWPPTWYDATGFAVSYNPPLIGPAYHTGVDLNLRAGQDLGQPAYAAAPGVVTFSGVGSGTWGNMIVIRHDALADGTLVWTRSAHLQRRLVNVGDRVARGQQIGTVGDSEGRFDAHLHFDIAKTNILEVNPHHWPGNRQDLVLQHYTDPLQFIMRYRPIRG